MTKTRGIIFDFDNTLVDSERAYDVGLRAIGVDPADARYLAARKRVKQRLGQANTQSHHRLLYFKQLWPDASPKHLLETHGVYEDAVVTDIARQWQALARERLLSALHKRYRMVILTNETARTQLAKWHACDPQGLLFEGLICSEEVGVQKPHPAMFAAACARLALPSHACAMVGDSWNDDIAPAQRLGMATWHTVEFSRGPSAPGGAGCTPSLQSLADLYKQLL